MEKTGFGTSFAECFTGDFRHTGTRRWSFTPILVLTTVLLILKTFVSSSYAPNLFLMGLLFGVPAGYLEEIGWMGYAFPKNAFAEQCAGPKYLAGTAGGALGTCQSLITLERTTPHGAYWLPFFLTFTAAMTAIRVLISWTRSNTK